MKKILSLFLFLFVYTNLIAQDFNKIENTQFLAIEDYKKAEPDVSKAANFLYSTPNKPETRNRAIALTFIIKWMEGTDAYTFNIDEDALNVTKGSKDLLGMYFAGLSKVVLDHQGIKLSDKEMHEKTAEILAQYCADKNNKLKPNKALKKIYKKIKKG